ncbi:MAG: hypothetical protein K2N90_06015 [Lachnospiraceae bacterium]|nr:hypothetical protein [Lachnospiraceae bacterium]
MDIKMTEINNDDKFLEYYLQHLFVFNELQIGEIESMVRFKGQGSEYVQCSFDEEDEDYKKGYVTLYFWKPALEEDTIVYIENEKFYNGLFVIVEGYINRNLKMKEKLMEYMKKIGEYLAIEKTPNI